MKVQLEGKIVGDIQPDAYHKFGMDKMRKNDSYAVAASILMQLKERGIPKVMLENGQWASVEDFFTYGKVDSFGDYETQVFLHERYFQES